MPLYKWSQTSSSNANADPTINFAEGQAPSSVNDSARALMSAVAMFRDDISGAIVTGGTLTAYTVTSNSGFDTLAHLGGQMIAFTPHATNGATVTLNVDGLGAKPLRSAPSTELLAGTIILGTPYVAVYNNSDAVFYLQGFYGNPYNVPLGAGMDYWLPTAPNSSFVFPIGQAISRTTYSVLFAAMGTTFGTGDGSTTFNLPDRTGRVSAMKEATATRLTSGFFGGDSTTLGAVGGLQSNNVILAHSHGITDPGHGHTISESQATSTAAGSFLFRGSANGGTFAIGPAATNTTGITINNAGSASAHNIVQPTIICNYILRII